jgi:hypothetical protein
MMDTVVFRPGLVGRRVGEGWRDASGSRWEGGGGGGGGVGGTIEHKICVLIFSTTLSETNSRSEKNLASYNKKRILIFI